MFVPWVFKVAILTAKASVLGWHLELGGFTDFEKIISTKYTLDGYSSCPLLEKIPLNFLHYTLYVQLCGVQHFLGDLLLYEAKK